MRVLAIIPARGGSKGIPRKNIINFREKPLIQWSIEAAVQSQVITDIVVSSDDNEILAVAARNKNINLLKRPAELAKDDTRTEPVLVHALNALQETNFDYFVLLQPTSPLRTARDIDAAFSKFINSKATSLISVCELTHHPYKSFKVDKNGFLEGILNNDYPFQPRQILPKTFKANGAIYIVEVHDFLKNKSFMTNKTMYFEMSLEKSLDIDSVNDLKK